MYCAHGGGGAVTGLTVGPRHDAQFWIFLLIMSCFCNRRHLVSFGYSVFLSKASPCFKHLHPLCFMLTAAARKTNTKRINCGWSPQGLLHIQMPQHTFVHICVCVCVSLYAWECMQGKMCKNVSAHSKEKTRKESLTLLLWPRPLHTFLLVIFNVYWNSSTLVQLGDPVWSSDRHFSPPPPG